MVRKVRKKGGWKTTKGLKWSTVQEVSALAFHGQLNTILHIMPDNGSDAERKRTCSRIVAHLGQALKRTGHEHIGVTIYEKRESVDLHCHHMFWLARPAKGVLEKYDGYIVQPEEFAPSKRDERVAYITKQRLPFSPEVEANAKHRRQQGAAITGARFSYTAAAQLIVDRMNAAPVPPAHEPELVPTASIRPVGQLLLFPELDRPITRLTDFTSGILPPSVSLEIEHRRKRLGLSQSQLAERAGLSQPQIANAVHCRFGLSRQAAARIKTALLSMERQAA